MVSRYGQNCLSLHTQRNVRTDQIICLAEQGRLSHPYNETRRAKTVAPDDQVFTRQDTDLPSHCSWVLSEYEGSMVEGGGGARTPTTIV